MKRLRQTIAFILVLVLVLGAVPAFAAEKSTSKWNSANIALYQAVTGGKTAVSVSQYLIPIQDADFFLEDFLCNYPELYYVSVSSYSASGNNLGTVNFEYNGLKTGAAKQAFTEAVNEALESVNSKMTRLQKTLALHDWLATHCSFDEVKGEDGKCDPVSRTAYGALVNGKAVGSGYARAFAYLTRKAGIPCYLAYSKSMDHCWNVVALSGKYYNADVAWDDLTPDLPGQVSHYFFLKSDAAFAKDAAANGAVHKDWLAAHACNTTGYDSKRIWTSVKSAYIFGDATAAYFINAESSEAGYTASLKSRDFSTGEDLTYATHKDCREAGITEAYSFLAECKGKLYYNDSTHIYSYDSKTKKESTVVSLAEGEGQIFGLQTSGRFLEYAIGTAPSSITSLKSLELYKEPSFKDVDPEDPYFEAVEWAAAKGIAQGIGPKLFGPQNTCNRGNVVTFLWRALGCPEPTTTENPFVDVKESYYCYKAVLWAVENGITDGIRPDEFRPNSLCQESQVLTFLWRALGKPQAKSVSKLSEGYENRFFYEALNWADEGDLLVNPAKFAPFSASPRSTIVTYLYNFYK